MDIALTGAKKSLPQRLHVPRRVSPPDGTTMCTWGWYWSWRPQVCSTAVAPVLAPIHLRSAAKADTVSQAQRKSRLYISRWLRQNTHASSWGTVKTTCQ